MTITRRDFLNGTALTIAAGLAPVQLLHAQQGGAGVAYPPALTGLRGNHPGTYTLAHSLAREGAKYPVVLAREAFDLVVVGGGLSGLAAAWFYRRRFGANRRILILDNHDDFGGHAKRNEFTVRGKRLVTYGGSAEMPAGAGSDAAVRELLAGIGLDAARPPGTSSADPYAALDMGRAVFFDAEHFGRDQWVAGDPFGKLIDARSGQQAGGPDAAALSRFLDNTPLPVEDRSALARWPQAPPITCRRCPAPSARQRCAPCVTPPSCVTRPVSAWPGSVSCAAAATMPMRWTPMGSALPTPLPSACLPAPTCPRRRAMRALASRRLRACGFRMAMPRWPGCWCRA